jgi:hypothetical protein
MASNRTHVLEISGKYRLDCIYFRDLPAADYHHPVRPEPCFRSGYRITTGIFPTQIFLYTVSKNLPENSGDMAQFSRAISGLDE